MLGRQMVLVGNENENVLLCYHIVNNLQIQFGREEFCLVIGLRFGVEYWADYDNDEDPIPFRRRVFPSSLDGEHITSKIMETLIDNKFDRLHDDDDVSLCCVGILQLVLLGVEGRRSVPDWILRLANDRVGWDKYPWGSYVWPTLYSQLKDANVRLWPSLYASQPIDEVDKKTYSIFEFTWAFKILGVLLPRKRLILFVLSFTSLRRLPLSTFLVDVLRHFRINISQLSMIEMDIFAFIHTPDPTKVKIVKQERNEDEPLLLATTIGCNVPLLSVAPDRAESELEASIDRFFDEGGSGNQAEQGDYAGVGEGANIQPVVEVVAPMQLRRQGKRKFVVMDADGASHPPKKLKEDHGTPGRTSVGVKSHSMIKRLLAGAMLNAEVEVAAIPTLSFMTAFVSSTPEREARDHTDFVAEPNLCTIGSSQRFVIPSNSSHHSGPTIAEAEVDSLVRSSVPLMTIVTNVTSTVDPALVAKEKYVKPSLFFTDSSSGGGANPHTGVFLDLTGSDFLVGGIHIIIDPDTDLQKVYVPQWRVTNGSHLDDGRIYREMIDEFAALKFFASVRGMEHDQLFTEFNVGATRQMCLSAKVRMRAEYNVKERRRLKSVVKKQDELLKARDREIKDLKSLRDETNALKERNVILEKERNALDVKVTELETSVAGKEREFTDLNALVRELELSSFGLQEKVTVWLLTQGMELAITKCLNLPEYLSVLGAAIGKDIEKVDYISALQQLQNVNFPMLAELKYNKEASIESVMNILHLEEPLADKLGLGELQPHVDQLMVLIHHSPDKENIANQRTVLHDVFVPLSEPLSAVVFTGTEGTSDVVSTTGDTTTALSTTFASASIIAPNYVDDYEVIGAEDQISADGNTASFPNVDDSELNIVQ
ncbi:gypsy type transposase [Tanacetum coccineum]|uniref:Gypsy type transposase n=1 Tax=Tanacetum coccineum TaxID=301880 RepID=A0ABQ5IR46_9ASTR